MCKLLCVAGSIDELLLLVINFDGFLCMANQF